MEYLEVMLKNKEKLFDKFNTELLSIGDGTLNVTSKAGRHYYIEYNEGSQRGISKKMDRVYQLARKEYLSKQIDILAEEIEMLSSRKPRIKTYKKIDMEEIIIKKYSMLDIERIIYSEKEYEWYRNRASQNPYMKENLRYATESGLLTRSKSERFIGDFLEKKRQLYRYEPKIYINGKVIYPDFMILRPDGDVVIWEHLGLMDNAEYINRAMIKVQEYRNIGFVQHKNLICTYEEDLRNKDVLEQIYFRYLFL